RRYPGHPDGCLPEGPQPGNGKERRVADPGARSEDRGDVRRAVEVDISAGRASFREPERLDLVALRHHGAIHEKVRIAVSPLLNVRKAALVQPVAKPVLREVLL